MARDFSGLGGVGVVAMITAAVVGSVWLTSVRSSASVIAYWRAVDSLVIGTITSEGMKRVFGRTRPSETNDPNQWFKGSGHRSFPSGEVMEITTAVTPFVLEYGRDHPAVYALELLPVYDAIARVKVRAHWQADVLASMLIGTGIGYYARERSSAISVGILPRGVTIGWSKRF